MPDLLPSTKNPASYGEVTGPQVVDTYIDDYTGEMARGLAVPDWYNVVKGMRRDPTIKLARLLSIAPALCCKWAVHATEDAPKGAKDLIEREVLVQRRHLLEHAMLNLVDFGWAPMEKVFYRREGELDLSLKKLKPLLHELTTIVVDAATGSFRGFMQYPTTSVNYRARNSQGKIDIPLEKCLLFSQWVEGTNWYGTSDMDAAYLPYLRWNTSDAVSQKFDRKTAGAHWVVRYPEGVSRIDGVEKPNNEVAQQLLQSLQANGSISIPNSVRSAVGAGISGHGTNKLKTLYDWEIVLIESAGNASASMKERQQYLDVLKVRAFGMPERALLEGQFGTKAEAEAHADVALAYVQHRHEGVLETANLHVVDHLLRLNYGADAKGTVKVVANRIGADEKLFLRDLYLKILTTSEAAMMELDSIDFEAVRDLIGVPESSETTGPMETLKRMLEEAKPDPVVVPPTDPNAPPVPPVPPTPVPPVPPVPPTPPTPPTPTEE